MPKKYLDFAESVPHVRLAKQNARDERDTRSYITITCPHCSVDFVEIAVDSLSTNKASECKKHLLRCEAASVAGVCPEPVKRKRTGAADVASDAALRVELEAERAKGTTLVASETRLTARNDELVGRVHSLGSQMDKMRADMEQMRLEMQQLRLLVPLVQRINQELNLTVSVPPAASIDTYVVRLAGLKKAAAAKLERENAVLKETNERLRRAVMDGKKFAQYGSLADPLFDDPKDSVTFVRKMVVCAHPDKHLGHKAAATAVTQTLNHLLQELRRS
jgi:hypothetical protein